MALGEAVADGLEQMRLAEPHAAVDEQRVVGLDGRLGDRQARGLGELVRGADDERVEAVARVEVRAAPAAAGAGAGGRGAERSIERTSWARGPGHDGAAAARSGSR